MSVTRERGIGKTVVAKRAATDLSRAGHLVFWARKVAGPFYQPYRELARAIRQKLSKAATDGSAFIFFDDPYRLGVAPLEVAEIFDSEGVSAALLFVVRNSERATGQTAVRMPHRIDLEVELNFELSPEEQDALPHFLVRAGAARDAADAVRILGYHKDRSASDILCRLWYLLPDTRAQLEDSLGDEFFRLENVDSIVGGLADSADSQAVFARRAYEAVAVTSSMGVGLPAEVLVSALQINWSEWFSMCNNGKPLWGLLYPEEDSTGEQFWYFTRNEVVTQILIRHINGGIGHAAEVRVLRTLLDGCTGSSPVYREFLIDVLVKNKDSLRRIVTPREGRELYERALLAFPVPDRTLMHHMGKWITDEEHLHEDAYRIFERALETPDYPYAAMEERREHIHTSMAAVIVQRIRREAQDRQSGLEAIKRHLREAQSPSFFNLYTVHVQVNALLSLHQGDDPISLDCFIESFRAIERAQQLAGAWGRRKMRLQAGLGALEDQKRRLAGYLAPFPEIRQDSLSRFDLSGDTLPLEAAAIRGLIDASSEDNGKKYNEVYQFLRKCEDKLGSKGKPLTLGLRQIRVDLMVRWRLQHQLGTVDWATLLGDIVTIRNDPLRRDDVLLLFYEGVAAFHMKRASDAISAFTRLRAIQLPGMLMREARIYLRDVDGRPAQVQGVLQRGAQSKVRLSEFNVDVPITRGHPPEGLQSGATVHCWVGFSFQGPTAEFREPDSTQLLLPS